MMTNLVSPITFRAQRPACLAHLIWEVVRVGPVRWAPGSGRCRRLLSPSLHADPKFGKFQDLETELLRTHGAASCQQCSS